MKLRNWLSGRTKRPAASAGRLSVHFPSTSMPMISALLHLGARDLDRLRVALGVGLQEPGPFLSRGADRLDAQALHTLHDVWELHHARHVRPDLRHDLARRPVGRKQAERRREI